MKVSYNWLKDYLGDDLPEVKKVSDLLTFHAFEIESIEETGNDFVIDVKVLPDRASDCLSHRGIARELASILDKNLKIDPLETTTQFSNTQKIKITTTDEKLCPRFMLALFDGVEVKESPEWLKTRLETIGQKSMNNIIDITNYVMFTLGQPLHAYDADLLDQSEKGWEFEIRLAKEDENIVLLPEKKGGEDRIVKLEGSELLVVNKSDDTTISLAGIKGGAKAGVSNTTTRIILEAGNFEAGVVRQTAKKLNINTDASKRFENKPSPFLVHVAIKMCADLISELASGKLDGIAEESKVYRNLNKVEVSVAKVNQVLGLQLSLSEVESILKRIGCDLQKVEDGFLVLAPAERIDLEIEANYIDEIGRLYGLERIEAIVPDEVGEIKIDKDFYYQEKFRNVLIEQGFSEVITSTFSAKDKVKLANALASDKSYLRSSLVPALKEVLKQNIQNVDILGLTDVGVFEIGTVFSFGKDKEIIEKTMLTLGVISKKTGYSQNDDKKLNVVLEELKKQNLINDYQIKEGVVELNLTDSVKVLPDPKEYEKVESSAQITYKPFSLYPAITRDVAMWVEEEVSAETVFEIIKKQAGPLCVRITLFDEFAKEGRVSYAFRLVFQSHDKTLTDAGVEPSMEAVYLAVTEAGFETR